MVSLGERINIINTKPLGTSHSHRKFRELNDIIVYLQEFERVFGIGTNYLYTSVKGLLYQFMCFDLPVKQRDKDEVVVYFCEDDPKQPTQPKIDVSMLWIDKKTRKVLDGPPGWFNEKKQKDVISKWN